MQRQQMQKEGTLGRVIFNNQDNGYTVAVFDTDEGSFRIAGSFADPKPGAKYRLEGKFTIHKRYGEQFSFTGYEEILPEGEDAILEFLSAGNIRGIGPKTAKLLVEAFGEETLHVIEETPEKLLAISGIGPKSLAKITESFGESREFADVSIELREITIGEGHSWNGAAIKDLNIPRQSFIFMVKRKGRSISGG